LKDMNTIWEEAE